MPYKEQSPLASGTDGPNTRDWMNQERENTADFDDTLANASVVALAETDTSAIQPGDILVGATGGGLVKISIGRGGMIVGKGGTPDRAAELVVITPSNEGDIVVHLNGETVFAPLGPSPIDRTRYLEY